MHTVHSRVQITDRDLALLRGLFESRLMTVAHAARLYFHDSDEAAKKRIQRLKAADVIAERPRAHAYDPSILFLTEAGFETLDRAGALCGFPTVSTHARQRRARVSPFTIRHELDVLTFKAAFVRAVRSASTLSVGEFATWPRLFAFTARQQLDTGEVRDVRMKPDGFVTIEELASGGASARDHHFFVEIDRSTETQHSLRARASGYLDYYRRGGFAERFGKTPEQFHEVPFRVLWIFRTPARLANAAHSFRSHNPPILTMPWLTTVDRVLTDPLGPIWKRPGDLGTRNAALRLFSPTGSGTSH